MNCKDERGAVMLEATWCVLAVLLICMLLISLGFLMYQHTVVQIVANEIAQEVSQTYKYKTAPDSSNVTASHVSSVGLCRYLFREKFDSAGERKFKTLVQSRLPQSSLARKEGAMTVDVKRVADDSGRYHLEISVEQRYGFLMGDILSRMGLSDAKTVKSTVYVAGTDMLYYTNMIRNWSNMYNMIGETKIGGTLSSCISIINSMIGLTK